MDIETQLEHLFDTLLTVADNNATLFGLRLGSADTTLHLRKGNKEKHMRFDRRTMTGAAYLGQMIYLKKLLARDYTAHKVVFRSRGKERIKKTFRIKNDRFVESHNHDRKKAK